METLYEILEVSVDASTSEIRKAYKRLSMIRHPDRGGTDAGFAAMKKAYEILVDPNKRAEYDSTGQEPGNIDLQGQALEQLARLLDMVFEQMETDFIDIIKAMNESIDVQIKTHQGANTTLLRAVEKIERALKRMKAKKGHAVILLQEQLIKQKRGHIVTNENNITLFERMKEIISDVNYVPDVKPKDDFGINTFNFLGRNRGGYGGSGG